MCEWEIPSSSLSTSSAARDCCLYLFSVDSRIKSKSHVNLFLHSFCRALPRAVAKRIAKNNTRKNGSDDDVNVDAKRDNRKKTMAKQNKYCFVFFLSLFCILSKKIDETFPFPRTNAIYTECARCSCKALVSLLWRWLFIICLAGRASPNEIMRLLNVRW